MGFYQFKRSQLIAAPQNEVWDFISRPENLKQITPPSMGFDITSGDLPEKMYAGMIIGYRVKPLLGMLTTWITEITHIRDQFYFVDEQRMGPYKIWHHQHILEPAGSATRMTDIVSYAPPFGLLGKLANRLIIRKKLREIFDFREKAMERLFPVR